VNGEAAEEVWTAPSGDGGRSRNADAATDRQAQAAFWFGLDHSTDDHGDSGLVEQGALQLSLLDQKNLVEISAPDYPGERLMVCHNPVLA